MSPFLSREGAAKPKASGVRFFIPLLSVLASACANCAHAPSQATERPLVTLLFTTALVGHLEPCGCSPDQLGGVTRAAAMVEGVRKEGTSIVTLA